MVVCVCVCGVCMLYVLLCIYVDVAQAFGTSISQISGSSIFSMFRICSAASGKIFRYIINLYVPASRYVVTVAKYTT